MKKSCSFKAKLRDLNMGLGICSQRPSPSLNFLIFLCFILVCVSDTCYRPSSDNSCTWKYTHAKCCCRPHIANFLDYVKPIVTSCNAHIQRPRADEDSLSCDWRRYRGQQHLRLVQLHRRRLGLPWLPTCSHAKVGKYTTSKWGHRHSRTHVHSLVKC